MTAVPRARAQQVAEGVTAAGLGLLVVVGFVASYETLRDLAATEAGFSPWLAALVPLSFDLGIVILSLRVVLAAHEGRTATVTRLLVATLALASVAANVAAAATVTGQLLHAVPPAMFVVCFETVIVAARRHALQRLGLRPAVSPHVRPLVWVLAPRATWTAWRDAVLGSGPSVAVGRQPLASVTDVGQRQRRDRVWQRPQPGRAPLHEESAAATTGTPWPLAWSALRRTSRRQDWPPSWTATATPCPCELPTCPCHRNGRARAPGGGACRRWFERVIGKVSRGRDVGGTPALPVRPGRHNEHTRPHLVAGWDDPSALEPIVSDGRADTVPLARLLEQPLRAGNRQDRRSAGLAVLCACRTAGPCAQRSGLGGDRPRRCRPNGLRSRSRRRGLPVDRRFATPTTTCTSS